MKRKEAKLRVCASCEWIFLTDENTEENGCPKCGFGHYGARFVYGNRAYQYKRTQQQWFNKKMIEYGFKLLKEIEDTNIRIQKDMLENLKNK
jgi:hypothetical protein